MSRRDTRRAWIPCRRCGLIDVIWSGASGVVIWQATIAPLEPGDYAYKLVIDGDVWIEAPANRRRVSGGFGAMSSGVALGQSLTESNHYLMMPEIF